MVEAVCAALVKLSFGSFAYFGGRYYMFKSLQHLVNISGQIDLSYETINPDLMKDNLDKYYLICGANEKEIIFKDTIERFNIKQLHSLNKLASNIRMKQNTGDSQSNDSVKNIPNTINCEFNNKFANIFDPTSIQTKQLDNNFISNLSSLTFKTKIEFISKYISSKLDNIANKIGVVKNENNTNCSNNTNNNLFLVKKGIVKDQRILVLGKIKGVDNVKNGEQSISVKPKALICSGLVEFEEMIEYLKTESSTRMFQTVVILIFLTVVDAAYKGYIYFVHRNDKKISKLC